MTPDATRTSPADGSVGDRSTLSHASVGDVPTVSGDAVRALQEFVTDTPNHAATRPAAAFDAPPGFAVERELGEGGMGVVYLARQVGLNRPVALKLVKGGKAVDQKALIRFLAEAEAVASLKHPNVVEVYQYGEHHGKPYMALEYCPGGDLTKFRDSVSRDPQGSAAKDCFRRVADLMAKVADGVNAAHAQGIVHRDLKPHNVFLAADGTPKVADFGLAKRGLGSDLTKTDAIMGTPAYMAPEQAGGGTKFVGPEADVWALGVMLYELFCGERPIELDSSVPLRDALARIVNAQVPPLQSKCPTVPKDLALIAHKCLSADPRDRYPTADGLGTDLRNWLDGKPISARKAGVIEQAVKWARRNQKLAGMGLAVLLTMALATAVSLGFGLESDKQAAVARQKQMDAEEASERAEKEKRATIAARNSLSAANSKLQHTLAQSIFGPITAREGFSWSSRVPAPTESEREAIWELATVRETMIGTLLLENAMKHPSTAHRFASRASFLLQAIVGLDPRHDQKVTNLVMDRLEDQNLSPELRLRIVVAGCEGDQLRLPWAKVATAALSSVPVAESRKEYELIAQMLGSVFRRIPAEEAAELRHAAITWLVNEIGNTDHGETLSALVDALVAVLGPLQPDLARSHFERAEKNFMKGPALAVLYAPTSTIEALVKLWQQLPTAATEKQATAIVRGRLSALETAKDSERFDTAWQVRCICTHCGVNPGVESLNKAIENAKSFNERQALTWALTAVCERGAGEQGVTACRRIAADYLDRMDRESSGHTQDTWADLLVRVCRPLPNTERATVATKALELLQRPQSAQELMFRSYGAAVAGLATLLPCEQATTECSLARAHIFERLSEGLDRREGDTNSGYLRQLRFRTADQLLSLLPQLPVEEATATSVRLAELLLADLDGPSAPPDPAAVPRVLIAECVHALSLYLPPDRSSQVRQKALDAFTADALGWNVTLTLGLPPSAVLRTKVSKPLSSLAGSMSLCSNVALKPRPLPPQQLVELLKHPFCVKEARRAVLDALEFTYDRKFKDVWDFVAFAEKEHPELDLLTPPKRPERK